MADAPYQISFSTGGVAAIQPLASGPAPGGALLTADLPAIDLGPGCRIEVGTYDLDGTPRLQDTLSGLALAVGDLTGGDE